MARLWPDWLAAYQKFTTHSEAPDSFHFWVGVSTVAGALRRNVWIDELNFTWTPNFYIVLVSPPGVATKSTTMNIGTDLLREVPGIHLGPSAATWQSLVQAFATAERKHQRPDGTFYHHCPLTCSVSELGTFLRTDDEGFINFIVDMWDSPERIWERATVSSGRERLPTPWLNLMACTTPSWLQANFNRTMLSGGLFSRTIFVHANKKRRFVAYPSELIPASDYKEHRTYLIEDLKEIAELHGVYVLEPEAIRWGTEWYKKHWEIGRNDLQDDRFGGYLARKQTHIHKLAIVLAASRRNDLIITMPDLQEAERIVTATESDLKTVLFAVTRTRLYDHIRAIRNLLEGGWELTITQLRDRTLSDMTNEEFSAVLSAMEQAGHVRKVVRDDALHVTLVPGTRL